MTKPAIAGGSIDVSSQDLQKVRILGIDPGTRIAGYGVVDVVVEGGSLKAVAAGAWNLGISGELPARLGALALEFRRVVEAYRPTHMCLELSFLAENPRTALFLGHARGVVLSEAFQFGLGISEISATSAKKIITGNGRACKKSVAKIMGSLLGFVPDALPFDATDALAIACADAMRRRHGQATFSAAGKGGRAAAYAALFRRQGVGRRLW